MKQEFYKNKEKIEAWLNEYDIENYTLIPNEEYGFVVNLNGNINLFNKNLQFIPIKFNIVNGYFLCYGNQLTSLEFCPQKIKGDFFCNNNKLTSLEFCPQEVGGKFSCSNNPLTSLKFSPQKINGDFICSNNQLTSLEFCPKEIAGKFSCNHNDIENLIYFPKEVNIEFVDLRGNEKLGDWQDVQDFGLLFKEHIRQVKEKENSELLNAIDKDIKSDIINKKIKI